MRVKDFDELQDPKRRPWLLLVVIVVLGVLLARRHRGERESRSEDRIESQPAEPVSVADPPATSVAGTQPITVHGKQAEAVLARGAGLERQGRLVEARTLYWETLESGVSRSVRLDLEARLGRINVALATTPHDAPEKVAYAVRRGDTVGGIANRFGTTVDLIQQSNNIADPNVIKPGDQFRILKADFEIRASKQRNDLLLLMNGRFFKRYAVGTGKFGKTPTGTFKITERMKNPVWWRPDGREIPFGHPENILGTRWMTLRATGDTPRVRGYGIHGTWDEQSIGKSESAGCIRMRNADVEELYNLVPVGCPVTIAD